MKLGESYKSLLVGYPLVPPRPSPPFEETLLYPSLQKVSTSTHDTEPLEDRLKLKLGGNF